MAILRLSAAPGDVGGLGSGADVDRRGGVVIEEVGQESLFAPARSSPTRDRMRRPSVPVATSSQARSAPVAMLPAVRMAS